MDEPRNSDRDPIDARPEASLLDEAALLPLTLVAPPRSLAVFVGGALGTSARYLLEAHHRSRPAPSPG